MIYVGPPLSSQGPTAVHTAVFLKWFRVFQTSRPPSGCLRPRRQTASKFYVHSDSLIKHLQCSCLSRLLPAEAPSYSSRTRTNGVPNNKVAVSIKHSQAYPCCKKARAVYVVSLDSKISHPSISRNLLRY